PESWEDASGQPIEGPNELPTDYRIVASSTLETMTCVYLEGALTCDSEGSLMVPKGGRYRVQEFGLPADYSAESGLGEGFFQGSSCQPGFGEVSANCLHTVVNRAAPVLSVGATETNEDTPLYISLSSTLELSVEFSGANNGLVQATEGGLIYTPNPNFNGQDVFTLNASNGSITINQVVTVTVRPVNDAPSAQNLEGTLDAGGSIAVILMGQDVDGDAISYNVLTLPMGGTLSGAAPQPDLHRQPQL
ncbi:MAG: hypothetical protein HC915_19840, partial [Anaerolineae bacterium]|nr:hypothetical protein [Anaerolineae bacterium]